MPARRDAVRDHPSRTPVAGATTDLVTLHAPTTDIGAMERLFIVEAISPGQKTRYVASENLPAMRLMRRIIENRLRSPAEYGARGATTRIGLIKARGQFEGFSNYPNLGGYPAINLPEILRIANARDDPRQPAYLQFVRDAITAATEAVSTTGPHDDVTAWRTAKAGSPGGRFRPVVTLSGNTFFRTVPADRRRR